MFSCKVFPDVTQNIGNVQKSGNVAYDWGNAVSVPLISVSVANISVHQKLRQQTQKLWKQTQHYGQCYKIIHKNFNFFWQRFQ